MKTSVFLIALLISGFDSAVALGADEECPDAELIALQTSNKLLAPSDLVHRIEKDLTLIRHKDPALRDVHPHPQWIPGKLNITGSVQYAINTLTSSKYGPVSTKHVGEYVIVDFSKYYHPYRLAEELEKNLDIKDSQPILVPISQSNIYMTGDILGTNRYDFTMARYDPGYSCQIAVVYTVTQSGFVVRNM